MGSSEKKSSSSKYAYVIVLIAFLTYFVGNYPQMQLSPLAPVICQSLHITVPQFSSVFTAPMIPGILLSIIAGLLSDRFGIKKMIGIASIISLAAVCARIWWGTTSYAGLFVTMLFSGVVATFLNSNFGKIMGTWFLPKRVGIMVGIASVGATSAMAIGIGTTALMPSVKVAYSVAAVISAVVTVLWFVLMREKETDTVQASSVQAGPSLGECIKVCIKNKYVWLVAIVMGLTFIPSMCLNMFLPTALAVTKGLDAIAAGGVASAVTFGNLFGAFVGPMICAKIGRTKPYLFAFILLTAIGGAFAWLAPAGPVMLTCLFITGFSVSAVISQMISFPVLLKSIGPAYAGTAGGLVGTIQLLLGVVLTSYVIAPIVGGNFKMLFFIGGALAAVGALLSLTLPELFGKNKKESV